MPVSSPGHGPLDESQGGFEMFRRRACHPKAESDADWRVGFSREHRAGNERYLAESIFSLFDEQTRDSQWHGRAFIDIGSGASELTNEITRLCASRSMLHVACDSPEMLRHLPPNPSRRLVSGRFPDVLDKLVALEVVSTRILAYSVLQYVLRDGILQEFVEALISLLPPGGTILLGDLPNYDLRKRQLMTESRPASAPDLHEIRDETILSLLSTGRELGLNSYCLPNFYRDSRYGFRELVFLSRPSVKEEG